MRALGGPRAGRRGDERRARRACTWRGTLRTFDEREREIIHRRIANIAADIDKRHGVRTDVGIGRGYPCVVNDEILVKRAVALAQETD